MIIGANPRDFPSIVDSAPTQFGIFYHASDVFPKNRRSAYITKHDKHFIYELRSVEGTESTSSYETEHELISRMTEDNSTFNSSRKATIEF